MSSKVVLVTGCSTGGIGYALCEEFARNGCKVYASSRRTETIADFKDTSIESIAIDVTNDASVSKAVEYVVGKEGKIDILVNNAGTIAPGPILEQDAAHISRVLETNTVSILRVSKAVTPYMAKKGRGLIVNVGSIVEDITTPWNGLYCASKAAVKSISEVMAMELQPLNVQVLHVAPGAITSNIASNATASFSLAPDSLWSAYLPDMVRRINASQGPNSMPNDVFAKKVVGKALSKNLSFFTYLSEGGNAALFSFLRWLPRIWVLKLMWKAYSKKA